MLDRYRITSETETASHVDIKRKNMRGNTDDMLSFTTDQLMRILRTHYTRTRTLLVLF